jgi:hypothetical protein
VATSNAQSGAAATASAKTCIAITTATVQGVEGSATQVGDAVRDLFASFLTGPSLQAVALESRLTSQAMEEARQKQCGDVVIATLTKKRSGGGKLGQVIGQSAGTAAWTMPYTGVASAAARSVAMASAQAVSTLAASTKAKDELRLEYRLTTTENAARLAATSETAKANVDGEDLLTPLVQRASEKIVAAISKPAR